MTTVLKTNSDRRIQATECPESGNWSRFRAQDLFSRLWVIAGRADLGSESEAAAMAERPFGSRHDGNITTVGFRL